MDNVVTPAQTQQALHVGLSELGMPDLASHRMTLLIRDGYYVGRRFTFDGVQVVWLTAEKVVRFYDENGQVLKSVAVETVQEQKAA